MKSSVVITFLSALAVAAASRRATPTGNTWVSSISSDASTSPAQKPSVAKTFEMDPANNISSIIHFSGSKTHPQSINTPATIHQCLNPHDAPISQDCESLCDNMSRTQGPILLQPFEIWHMEAGHCIFGLANLDSCDAINVDPISSLAPYCWSMYYECAVDGYDAYIEQEGVAMAMSGTEAAPPYPSPREC
ncbi:hypothetical protein F4804DRAFT_17928 [Jackrogersella minutella]|nr:hypothetical protein F4804DRAFT_17928 [Jackrogersella minutella]